MIEIDSSRYSGETHGCPSLVAGQAGQALRADCETSIVPGKVFKSIRASCTAALTLLSTFSNVSYPWLVYLSPLLRGYYALPPWGESLALGIVQMLATRS